MGCPLLYSFRYSFFFLDTFFYHYYLLCIPSPPGYLILESSFWLLWDFPNFFSGFNFSLYLSSSLIYTILHIGAFWTVFGLFLKQRALLAGFAFTLSSWHSSLPFQYSITIPFIGFSCKTYFGSRTWLVFNGFLRLFLGVGVHAWSNLHICVLS